MFSGIVEEKGIVQKIEKKQNLYVLSIKAKKVLPRTKVGDSISVNGVCLTITKVKKPVLTFDLMKETIDKTTFKYLKKGSAVNLERALKANGRLDGHFVSGHVDGVSMLKRIVILPNYVELQITISKSLRKYIAPKGSVAVDGVSLTIGDVRKADFSVYLIPYTLDVTNLGIKKVKDKVNIETDILAKYVLNSKRSSAYSYNL